MEEKRYSVTLADGSVLSDLRLNGNTFISEEPVDPAVFEENCSPVVISDGETSETHPVMEYVATAQPVAGEFWFSLRDVSEQELREMRRDANIEYLAMMAGIEL